MHSLKELKKQQVGLRLHSYLISEIDEFTKQYSLNRTDIITEAIKSYLDEQKTKLFYEGFDASCKEVKQMQEGTLNESTLSDLIDELKTDTNS
jgi:metal-responsive CopG/Arc/MetJ family transcriptional regulator